LKETKEIKHILSEADYEFEKDLNFVKGIINNESTCQ
jgi:hypothetical protein